MKLLKVIFFFAFIALIYSSCDKDPLSQFEEPVSETIKYGDSKTMAGGLSIKVEKIDESRCPDNTKIQCLVPGEARVQLKLLKGNDSSTATLIAPGYKKDATENLDSVIFKGYTIILNNVSPYPIDGTPTEVEDYLVKLTIK